MNENILEWGAGLKAGGWGGGMGSGRYISHEGLEL